MDSRVGCRKAVILAFLAGLVLPVAIFLVALIALVSAFWDMADVALKLFIVMSIALVALPLIVYLVLDLYDELEKCEYS